MSTISKEQLAFDQQHIWHPYSSMLNPPSMHPVVSAAGVKIKLNNGQELIDGMSSWWAAIHGYNHPVLNAAAKQQIDQMAHVMFGGLTHQPAINLCQKLLAMTPNSLDKVFLADSGSIAVEVAMKMAIQYWYACGETNKHRFLTIRNGYHGDTFGAMSVCDPINGMHEMFSSIMPQNFFAPPPKIGFAESWQEQDIAELGKLIKLHHQEMAALILEPIVQGAGGMRFYSPEYLKQARKLCDQYQILFIADEIATGFGRTGKLFACNHANIEPDILCLGKALSGGYITLAATLTNTHIAETISAGDAGCFMHGPTFMANPLACAIANASLDLLADMAWQTKVQTIEAKLREGLSPLTECSSVADVRCLGAIGVIEMKQTVNVEKIQHLLMKQGLWIRPFGKLIYVMPAYVITTQELNQLTSGMVTSIYSYSTS